MAEGFIGEIKMFGGNFAPRTWAFCEGQLISVSSNNALFAIVGTIYGGDGRTTFGLPDLRGRVPGRRRHRAGAEHEEAGGEIRHRNRHPLYESDALPQPQRYRYGQCA